MQRIAVMGAGAVGCYFGGMLARAGADVTLIARGAHLQALVQDGLYMDSLHFQERVPVRATSDPAAVSGAELVLFSVKTTGTAAAAQAIAPHLAPGAVVLSLQNGVDNVAQIRAASGIEALPSVVYVAASLPKPGRIRHGGRGDLIIGDTPRPLMEDIAQTFQRAGVPCRLSDNLEGDLWQKLIVNCAGNAVCALGRVGYGPAARNVFSRRVMGDAEAEARSVALATGVRLPQSAKNLLEILEKYDPEVTSSTAQDIAHKRRTEIDALNGYVVCRGEELGVATPVNRTLHALVKLLEESF